MNTARGHLDIQTDNESPFLEEDGKILLGRDGKELGRQIKRIEYSGDMVGKSEAHMVAHWIRPAGWFELVAIEHFTGSVGGKSGSFALFHSGKIFSKSGTGELTGISGNLHLEPDSHSDGKHSYVLNYELP